MFPPRARIFRLYLQWWQRYTILLPWSYTSIILSSLDEMCWYWREVEHGLHESCGGFPQDIVNTLPWARAHLIWPAGASSLPNMNWLQYFTGSVTITLESLSDRILGFLPNIRTLRITDAERIKFPIQSSSFQKYLSNHVTFLSIPKCNSSNLTDDHFKHLSRLIKLNISRCTQENITNQAFCNLPELAALDISFCRQTTLTDDMFRNLSHLTKLFTAHCTQSTLTDQFVSYLPKLKVLNISGCEQLMLRSSTFSQSTNLEFLRMNKVNNMASGTSLERTFKPISNLQELSISGCKDLPLSSSCFKDFSRLQRLDISFCTQIEDEVFQGFSYVTYLSMVHCDQSTLTTNALSHLKSLEVLDRAWCGRQIRSANLDDSVKCVNEIVNEKELQLRYMGRPHIYF